MGIAGFMSVNNIVYSKHILSQHTVNTGLSKEKGIKK
jgi:hypothetical protein